MRYFGITPQVWVLTLVCILHEYDILLYNTFDVSVEVRFLHGITRSGQQETLQVGKTGAQVFPQILHLSTLLTICLSTDIEQNIDQRWNVSDNMIC